jgi:hypothetical protein
MFIYCKQNAETSSSRPIISLGLHLLQTYYEETLLVWEAHLHLLQEYRGRGFDQELYRIIAGTALPLNVWGTPQSLSRMISGSKRPAALPSHEYQAVTLAVWINGRAAAFSAARCDVYLVMPHGSMTQRTDIADPDVDKPSYLKIYLQLNFRVVDRFVLLYTQIIFHTQFLNTFVMYPVFLHIFHEVFPCLYTHCSGTHSCR